jgi:sec-independent protein translocase protein TatA
VVNARFLKSRSKNTNIKRNFSKEENMLGGIGAPELLLFLLIIVVLFGASRLRDVGGALGGAIRDFRSAVSGADEEQDKGVKEEQKAA